MIRAALSLLNLVSGSMPRCCLSNDLPGFFDGGFAGLVELLLMTECVLGSWTGIPLRRCCLTSLSEERET